MAKGKGIGKATKKSSKKKSHKKSAVHYLSTNNRYKPMKRSKAARIVNNDIRALVGSINRDVAGVRRRKNADIQKAEDLFTRGKGDLDYIFGEVQDTVGAKNAAIQQQYADTGSKMQLMQQALQADLAAQSGGNRDAAAAELQRLGIQQAGLGQFDADAANAQAVATQSSADANANLNTAAAMSGDIGNILMAMNSGQHLSDVGRITNTRNTSVADITNSSNEDIHTLVNAIKDARGSRRSEIARLYEQMNAQRFDQWMGGKQLDQSAMDFNLNLQQTRRQNAIEAAQRRAAQRRASSIRSYGGSSGSGIGYSTSSGSGATRGAPSYNKHRQKNTPDFWQNLHNSITGAVPWGHGSKKKKKKLGGSGYSPSGKYIER